MRRRGTAAADAMARRVDGLARGWRPSPSGERPADSGPRWPAGETGLDALRTPEAVDDPWGRIPTTGRAGAWSPRALRALVLLVVGCLVVAGWWWWSGRPREVIAASAPVVMATGAPLAGSDPEPVPTAPPPDPARDRPGVTSVSAEHPAEDVTPAVPGPEVLAPIVVHVSGDVARPGLVRLAPGSRVADAVAAAGGVTRRRAADSVNLARLVVDGEQIVVDADVPAASRPPQQGGGTPVGGSPAGDGSPGAALDDSLGASLVVDLNVAGAAALEELPGVGPVLAGRIVEWRERNGPFRSVEELGEVSGIGDATLARLRPLVRV